MLLCKYYDVTLAAKDAAAYTPCLRPHRKLMLTAILLIFSPINLKIMNIQKTVIINISIKNILRALFM